MRRSLQTPQPKGIKAKIGAIAVGRFSVPFTVANYVDEVMAEQGTLAPERVRRLNLSGVVDSGAARLVLPRAVVLKLGLTISGTLPVKHANGLVAERETVHGVAVELLGRSGVYSAIVEPRRRDALIGALVLEDLDFLIDPKNEQIVPRDPRGPIYEI